MLQAGGLHHSHCDSMEVALKFLMVGPGVVPVIWVMPLNDWEIVGCLLEYAKKTLLLKVYTGK